MNKTDSFKESLQVCNTKCGMFVKQTSHIFSKALQNISHSFPSREYLRLFQLVFAFPHIFFHLKKFPIFSLSKKILWFVSKVPRTDIMRNHDIQVYPVQNWQYAYERDAFLADNMLSLKISDQFPNVNFSLKSLKSFQL